MNTPNQNTPVNSDQVEFYKKWHTRGFLSASYWHRGNKVVVEIGSIDPDSDNALTGVTKCFLPASQFMAYLRAEVYGNTENIFKDFAKYGVTFYAGGEVTRDGRKEIVSRVWNSVIRSQNQVPDPFSRTFTCTHYPGEKQGTGIVVPISKAQALSRHSIKMTLPELADMFERLQILVQGHALVDIMDETDVIEEDLVSL